MQVNKPAETELQIRPAVAEKLGHYVYAYVDPRNGEVFYVGKGCRGRVLSHLDEATECEKTRRLDELKRLKLKPRIDILQHGIPDDETALRIESAIIDVLSPRGFLTNRVRGFRSLDFGRMSVEEITGLYDATPIKITEPAILIRIKRLYRPDMDDNALYEATRGVWARLGARKGLAKYALAIFNGVVRQVYRIHSWHPAGTTPCKTRQLEDVKIPGRWEFQGAVDSLLSQKYRGCSVAAYFKRGFQAPCLLVNC